MYNDETRKRIKELAEESRQAHVWDGIPSFYKESLPSKKKKLEKLLKELYKRLGTSDPGSQDYNLTKEKVEQVRYEINRIDSRAIKWRERGFLLLGIIGVVLAILTYLFNK